MDIHQQLRLHPCASAVHAGRSVEQRQETCLAQAGMALRNPKRCTSVPCTVLIELDRDGQFLESLGLGTILEDL